MMASGGGGRSLFGRRLSRLMMLAPLVLVAPAMPAAGGQSATPITTIEGGRISGVRGPTATVFRDIPYGVAARWEAPRSVAPWPGVRDGARPGPICPQKADDESPGDRAQSEDCLNLNVWVPNHRPAKRLLPVMFWIHGGSFRVGSGSLPLYDGEALTAQGVILVSVNYRLGVLGRFAHPDLSREQAGKPRADYGLMDQIAALQWVRRNIRSFGGDPNNVTIFGYSAGGVSVNYLMAAPSAKGLFHKAIAQSGGIQIETTRHISERRPGLLGAPLEAEGVAMARRFGSAASPASLNDLRKLPAAALIADQEKNAMGSLNPVVDGVLIPDDIGRAFRDGQQARVPYMAGSTNWEDSLLHYLPTPLPPRAVLAGIDGVEAARAAFGGVNDAALAKAWFADSVFQGTAHYLTRANAQAGQPSYLYLFDYVPTALRDTVPGAAHGAEVPYIFGTLPQKIRNFTAGQITAQDRKVSSLMTAYWTNFAKTGDPNGRGLPTLVSRGTAGNAINILDQSPHVVKDFKAREMTFLDQYYAERMDLSK